MSHIMHLKSNSFVLGTIICAQSVYKYVVVQVIETPSRSPRSTQLDFL